MMEKLFKRPDLPAEGQEAGEKAGRLFDKGWNCAQAVLQAATGSEDPRLMEMTEPFRGGIGDTGCLCGALAGGVMALGLMGQGKKARLLVAAFKERNGATCCKVLSRSFQWMGREHLANCRRLTMETAATVEKLLG